MSINLRVALEISARPFDASKEDDKPFKCCVCTRSFSGIGFLKAHFQRTHKNAQFTSPVLKKITVNKQIPPSEKFNSKSKIFKSKFSGESASGSTSSSPWFAKTEEPLVCQRCNKSFSTRYDFMKHRFSHPTFLPCPFNMVNHFNRGGTTSRTTSLACKTCKKIFLRYNVYKEHFSVKCELCMGVHCKDWLYMKEICSKGKECHICLRELCEKCHMLHRNEPIREEVPEKCVVCNEICKDKKSLKEHYINVHELSKISL